jgi:hypothetical protein
MKDIRTLLRDADPLRGESGLSDADAARLRSAVVGSARNVPASGMFWRAAFAAAAILALVIAAGMFAARKPATPEPLASAEASSVQPVSGERRQLQFATPGGTRIIWTLDPDFQLKGVAP